MATTTSTRSSTTARCPGEGEFDIPGYIDACRDAGYAGPWGVEVLSEELRNQPHRGDLPPRLRDDRRQFRASVSVSAQR